MRNNIHLNHADHETASRIMNDSPAAFDMERLFRASYRKYRSAEETGDTRKQPVSKRLVFGLGSVAVAASFVLGMMILLPLRTAPDDLVLNEASQFATQPEMTTGTAKSTDTASTTTNTTTDDDIETTTDPNETALSEYPEVIHLPCQTTQTDLVPETEAVTIPTSAATTSKPTETKLSVDSVPVQTTLLTTTTTASTKKIVVFEPASERTEGVSEFRKAVSESQKIDIDSVRNITPPEIAEQYGISLFKVGDWKTCLLHDGFAYELADCFGNYDGCYSLALADMDDNGANELYYIYHYGSGVDRMVIMYIDLGNHSFTKLYEADFDYFERYWFETFRGILDFGTAYNYKLPLGSIYAEDGEIAIWLDGKINCGDMDRIEHWVY